MSDSNYGLDGSGDGWTASYESPTDQTKKEQPLAAAASASPTDTSSAPWLTNSGSSSSTPAASSSLYAPAPASTPAATPAVTGPDPVAADQQARSIANSLSAAGHDISWSGNQLMVDGRPYDVTATGGSTTGAKPTGGNFRDPTFAAQYVSYMANQPGSNPSLKNDPNYWIGKLTSGELGSDESWIANKMMQPEGAPAGSGSSFSALSTFTAPPLAAAQPFTAPAGNVSTIDPNLIPSYAQVSSIGDPSALSPNIAMSDAPWGSGGIPSYQAGNITSDDIPNFTPESLRAQMNSGGASSSLDSLIQDIEKDRKSVV